MKVNLYAIRRAALAVCLALLCFATGAYAQQTCYPPIQGIIA